MLKQLLITFAIVSLFGVFVVAQEQPATDKKEKQECSKSCCAKHESNSEMQMKESEETASVQIWNKVCPVTGKEVDSKAPIVEYNGKVIGFCCPGCDTKFAKNPEKYAKNLSEDGKRCIEKK
ncbi:MAG TPA: YHS domain-containing protein [Ignavibacteriaceae bacterium]|jgi:YHS domain-containing protein|nr:YHS domain-containing protein [Ignavibacteriaceae bacterium]